MGFLVSSASPNPSSGVTLNTDHLQLTFPASAVSPHSLMLSEYPIRVLDSSSWRPTTTITTTSYSTVTCTYSSAALAACTTRKRRGITVDDDEDQQFIEASPVERVIATQAADMDAVREKRQFFESMNDLAEINASYDYDQSLQRTPAFNFMENGRFLFNIQTVTTTTTLS